MMKNIQVLNRFAQYVGSTAAVMAACFLVVWLSNFFFGDYNYGIIAMMGTFMLVFLFGMAKSDVESKARQARWDKEDADRKSTKRTMLME